MTEPTPHEQYAYQQILDRKREESRDKPGVFIPVWAARCTADERNKTKFGNNGYYNGVRVYRYMCDAHLCKWRYAPDGSRTRIVTFHFVNAETGERIADERRPHDGRGR